jgi:uncharacterized membrane protein
MTATVKTAIAEDSMRERCGGLPLLLLLLFLMTMLMMLMVMMTMVVAMMVVAVVTLTTVTALHLSIAMWRQGSTVTPILLHWRRPNLLVVPEHDRDTAA